MFHPGGEPRLACEVARAGTQAHAGPREAKTVPRNRHVSVGVRPVIRTLDDEDAGQEAPYRFIVARVQNLYAFDQGFPGKPPLDSMALASRRTATGSASERSFIPSSRFSASTPAPYSPRAASTATS